MSGQDKGNPSVVAQQTNQAFVEQLTRWGFRQRKIDGPHLVFRGPHGGTLRVVRSMSGHAEDDRIEKAAQLAGVTPERFWVGPHGVLPTEAEPEPTAPRPPTPAPATATHRPKRSRSRDRDRVTALVLGVHAETDRPLGFDQVVELLNRVITRAQVRTASAQLCREGDLHRIRSGVYQWSGGVRARTRTTPAPPAASTPLPAPREPEPVAPTSAGNTSVQQLFAQLFPAGIQMNAELFADVERWTELTAKLAQHARAS